MCDTLHTHISGAGIQIQVRYLDSYWLKGQYGPRFVVLGVNGKGHRDIQKTCQDIVP